MEINLEVMLLRLALAAAIGMAIGLEREKHGRAAGLRTCVLVCMTGALVMILSLHLAQCFAPGQSGSIFRLDPARLPSYALASMGFLGAGAIIQGRHSAKGITTGATLWALCAIGLSVGAGLYWPALAAAGAAFLALWLLRFFEGFLSVKQEVTLTVEMRLPEGYAEVRDLLAEYKARVIFVGRRHCNQTATSKYEFALVINSGTRWRDFWQRLEEIDGMVCYTWQEQLVP